GSSTLDNAAMAGSGSWPPAWHRLPLYPGLLALLLRRRQLQGRNLFDTGVASSDGVAPPAAHCSRTLDGSWNDSARPRTGSVGGRFGRNVPLELTYPEQPPRLLQPSPRRVSRELMTRERFIPATTLNVLAAAWIQFEVHDWVFHGIPDEREPFEI